MTTCETCGVAFNPHHWASCPKCYTQRLPESGYCQRCRCNTSFEMIEGELLSVCCTARRVDHSE